MKKIILLLSLITANWELGTNACFAQPYTRTDTVPVKVNGNWLKNPWAGGHNYCQLSDIDLNSDGIKDLFVFDKTGHKVTTYINKGTPNTVDYVDATSTYASKFPHLEDWVLLLDYNGDGKEDIFTYSINVCGIKVWRNTSTGGNLQFTLQAPYIKTDYTPGIPDLLSNLCVTRVDIPAIEDVDNDGDLDILTFDYTSTAVEYHINQSVEKGYLRDSLIFILDSNGCWGNFQEDANTCGISLISCRNIHSAVSPRIQNSERERHTGSCLLCLDMDADADKDIIIADISCCSFTMLTNGGSSSSANMISKDTTFPSTNIPVNMSLFPCGYFLDVNNDDKRDLVASPNAQNVSVDGQSIWYYQNMGTDSAPVFERIKRNFLQDEMIEMGAGANPVFFDFNADGLKDLLVSNYSMTRDSCPINSTDIVSAVSAFKNIGTSTKPKFEFVTSDFALLSNTITISPNPLGKHLTFGDLDGDGDQDMIMGEEHGFIHYFNNTAGAGNPCDFILAKQNYTDSANFAIDVGNYSTPQLIDADRDGDLDLIIGEAAGNLNYYQNIGTPAAPSFSLKSNSFGGVDVLKRCCTGYSVPFMYDSSGTFRLLVASEADRNYPAMGSVWYYKNIDGNLAGNFALVDSMYQNIWEGLRMTINGGDIDSDGDIDLVIGNYAGGAGLYMNNGVPSAVDELNPSAFDFTIYPNPSSSNVTINIKNFSLFSKAEVVIYNTLGEMIYSRNIQTANCELRTGHLAAGIYTCVLKTNTFSKTKKIIVLK